MKRKLRKSLSWLLTVAMIFSLFCGMIPTASAVDSEGITDITGDGVYGGRGNVEFRLYTTDAYKLLKLADPTITADTTINSVTLLLEEEYLGSNRFTLTGGLGTKIPTNRFTNSIANTNDKANPSNITGIEITYDGEKTVTIQASDLRLESDIVTTPGVEWNAVYEIKSSNDEKCVVAFYDNGETDAGAIAGYELYAVRIVNSGSTVGKDDFPPAPEHISYSFVSWNDKPDGEGTPFDYDTVVTSDMNIYARNVSGLDVHTGTVIHVMNEDNALLNRYIELYNEDPNNEDISLADFTQDVMDSMKVTIHGEGTEATNPDYWLSGLEGQHNGWIDDDYFLVLNYNAELLPEGHYHNTHIPATEISGITVEATIDGQTVSVYISQGSEEGQISVSPTDIATEWRLVLNGSSSSSEGNDINQFEKNLVTSEPTGITLPSDTVVKYPAENETVEVPVNGSVTLMYQFTVEGKADTQFTIADEGATAVGGDYDSKTSEVGSIAGVIPNSGIAVIYAIKTFTAADIDKDSGTGYLTNHAEISVGPDDTIAGGENQDDENVPAEEGAPVPPTEEELEKLLDDGAVLIHCTTAETSFNHAEVTYGLLSGGYSSTGAVTGTGEDGNPWTYTITVTPDAYVEQYSTDMAAEHELNPGQPASQNITLNWTKDTGWAVASEVPVVYTVTCDDDHWFQIDSEYHIMDLDAIKKAVVDTVDGVDSAANVGIFAIYVHGTTDDNVSGTATGRFDTDEIYYDDGILGMGAGPREPDEGVAWNGYHPNDGNDYWLVQNTSESVNNDTITGITIYYKNNGTEGNVLIPYTDLDVNHLEGLSSHITEIYLHTISDEPEPEPGTYTLTYNYNDASEGTLANTETDDQKYAAGATVTLKTDVNDQYDTEDDGVVVVGWTKDENNYTKSNPATAEPTDMVPAVTFQDENITVYAAWAQDADNDGIPDYNDPNFESQTVYVYAKPTGSNPDGTLTDAEIAYLEETYDLTLNSDGYCVLGKLTNVLLPKASEQDDSVNYFEQYEAVITAALNSFTAHEDAPADVETLIDTLRWNHLGVANGAEGYDESEAPSDTLCWHLDGDLDINAKYDLTFHANGGGFPNDQTDSLVIENLVAGTYGFNTTNLPNYAEPTHEDENGVEVLFVGWTTEEPTGTDVERIYQAGDTDVPATVSSVIVSADTQLWAVWGYNEDADTGDKTPDVNQIVITPADITIYTGGEGYSGIVTEQEDGTGNSELIPAGDDNGFPEPGYFITLPAALNNALLGALGTDAPADGIVKLSEYVDFTYSKGTITREWPMSTYDEEGASRTSDLRYIYRLGDSKVNGTDDTIAIRISITDSAGNYVGSDDEFTPSPTSGLYEEYSMTINPGELDRTAIKLSLREDSSLKDTNFEALLNQYTVFVDSGTLTVRGVNDTGIATHVREIADAAPTDSVERITAHADGTVDYYINDSELAVDETHDVMLLADSLTNDTNSIQTLKDAALKELEKQGINTDGLTFTEFRYLDLVDNSNGNAYVTLDEDQTIDIYWPNPDEDSEAYYVIHFDGLDRNFSLVSLKDQLAKSNIAVYSNVAEEHSDADNAVKELTVDQHNNLVFATGTFSPFVVAYRSGGSTTPGTDPNPDDNDDDHYTGGGGNDNDSEPTGNLSIELDVNGGDDEFTFTVYFTDEDGDDLRNNFYYNGDYTGTIGSGDEITLEGGDKIVIRNLPEGTRYEVIIETADGYTYVIDGEEGIIRTGTNEAEFTATRTVPLADPSVTGVSRWLNVTDHIAYLTGYPGGAFGPDNSMTRAEVAQMFYALLNNKNVTITKTFPDVPANAWYATAVNTLASLGMVSGDANGNYRPNDPITRAEFCVIALAFAYEPDNAVCYFSDVSRSDWFYTYVAQAASYGWIGGYTNGNFGPNDRITRAQVTTIVNNMLGRAADRDYVIDHQADLVQFTDLNRTYWGYYQIMEATNAHDYTKSNGTENWR